MVLFKKCLNTRILYTFRLKKIEKNYFRRCFSDQNKFSQKFLLKHLLSQKNYFKTLAIGQIFNKMSSSSSPIVIEPSSAHKATMIFLHGLGDTGQGWEDYWACLGVPGLKIILPTAPSTKVTLNFGMKMPAWFDIYGLTENTQEDESGIKKSAEFVHNLIEEEISKSGLSSDKVFVGGFSQGGALAIYSSLTFSKKLGGAVIYSCWLPLHKQIVNDVSEQNREIKILQCHGDADVVVPLKWGETSRDCLLETIKNNNVSFKVYRNMGHSGCVDESKDTKEFLTKTIYKS